MTQASQDIIADQESAFTEKHSTLLTLYRPPTTENSGKLDGS